MHDSIIRKRYVFNTRTSDSISSVPHKACACDLDQIKRIHAVSIGITGVDFAAATIKSCKKQDVTLTYYT